jgi:zinc/manganese transport system ATP-binding protein
MQKRQALLFFENLTLGYERHPAVHHLRGEIQAGDLLALVGPNGAGKSTLLKGLMNELRPLGGRILWPEGKPSLAYLPQRSGLNLDFPLRVADFVSLGHWPRLGAFSAVSRRQRRAVDKALAQVGMEGFERRSLDSLSGGQLQRILFARLLLEDAELLLLDEPFAAVDEQTTADLLELIHTWNREGRTVIAVLHDLRQVREHFPKTLLLARDALALGPTEQVLTEDNLARARRMQAPFDPLAAICEADFKEPH